MLFSFFTGTFTATPSPEKKIACTQRPIGNYWAFYVFNGQDLIANLSDKLKIMDPSFATCDDIDKLPVVIIGNI